MDFLDDYDYPNYDFGEKGDLPTTEQFLAMVFIIVSIFAFFGYKLYVSLVEKQKKREEKLKAKQSKKKK